MKDRRMTPADRDETETADPRREEGALAPFFAAARDAAPAPEPRLDRRDPRRCRGGDAAGAAAGRRNPLAPLLDLLGGWRGAGAVAASALIGFGIGLSGGGPVPEDPAAWLTGGDVLATLADPVAPLFDSALDGG
jgi:hypothetical protein